MSEMLEGVEVYMDDISLYGKSEQGHNIRLKQFLKAIKAAGLKLNIEKCMLLENQL